MALDFGAIQGRLLLDDGEFSAAIRSAISEIGTLDKRLQSLEDIGRKAGKGLADGFGNVDLRDLENRFNSFARTGFDAFSSIQSAGANYEQELLRIGTLFQGTEAELQSLGDNLRNVSVELGTGVGPVETLSAYYDILSAQFTETADASRVLEASLKLAAVGQSEVSGTTKLLTGILKAYGDTSEKAALRADQLFKIVDLGNITMPELEASFGKLVALSVSAGISFEEVSAALAAATANGQKGSTAIDGLSGIISKFVKPTKEGERAMAELGIQIDANTLRSEGFIAQLDKLTGASKTNARAFNEILGEQVAISVGSTLLNKGLGDTVSAFEALNTAGGKVDSSLAVIRRGANQASKELKVAFDVLKISATNASLPIQTELTKAVTQLVEGFNKLSPETKNAGLAITGLGTAFFATTGFMIGTRLAFVAIRNEALLLGATVIPRLTFAFTALNIPLTTAIRLLWAKVLAMGAYVKSSGLAIVANARLAASFVAINGPMAATRALMATTLGPVSGLALGLGSLGIALVVATKAFTDLQIEANKANEALLESDNLRAKGKKDVQGPGRFTTPQILETSVKDLAKSGLTVNTVSQRILDELRGAETTQDEGIRKRATERARRLKLIRSELAAEISKIEAESKQVQQPSAEKPKEESNKDVKANKSVLSERLRFLEQDREQIEEKFKEVKKAEEEGTKLVEDSMRQHFQRISRLTSSLSKEKRKQDSEEAKKDRQQKKAEQKLQKQEDKQTASDLLSAAENSVKSASADNVTGKDKANEDKASRAAAEASSNIKRLRSDEFSGAVLSLDEFIKQQNEDFGFKKTSIFDKAGKELSMPNMPELPTGASEIKQTPSFVDYSKIGEAVSDSVGKLKVEVPVSVVIPGIGQKSGRFVGSTVAARQNQFQADFEVGGGLG